MKINIFGVSLLSVSLFFSAATLAQPAPDYTQLLEQAHQKFKDNFEGKVADYIPALATYSPTISPSPSPPLTATFTRLAM